MNLAAHAERMAWTASEIVMRPRTFTVKREMVSKESVDYRPASSAHHCGNCVMFHEDTHKCDLVKGHIEANGVCDRWEAEPAEKSFNPLESRDIHGRWYHGTRASLKPGDTIDPGKSKFGNAVFATSSLEDAQLYARQARGFGEPAVYEVEPGGVNETPYGGGVSQLYQSSLPMKVIQRISAGPAEKARRIVGLNGQETWADGDNGPPYPASGGGAPLPPGGVPGATAGGEPPRWDGGQPEPRTESAPDDEDDALAPTEGRVAPASRGGVGFPATYMDGYWPGGGHGTQQAGTSSPGGERGVPPSTVRGKNVEKVGPKGYIHGFICVRPPCGEKPSFDELLSRKDLKLQKDGLVVHQPTGWAIGRADSHDDGTFTVTHANGDTRTVVGRQGILGAISTMHAYAGVAERANMRRQGEAAALRAPVVTSAPAASGDLTGDNLWKSDSGLRTRDLASQDIDDIRKSWYDYYPAMGMNDFLRSHGYEDRPHMQDDPRVQAGMKERERLASMLTGLIMSSRPFSRSAVTYRYADSKRPFGVDGRHSPGDVVVDRGFVSVSAKPELLEERGSSDAKITVKLPAGTRALRAEPQFYRGDAMIGDIPIDYENFHEYTLPPGTKFRVVSDNGDVSDRQITVEVMP